MSEPDDKVTLHEECQLLGYGESDTTGVWVKIRLPDRECLDHIDGLKGERFYVTLIKILNDGTTENQYDKPRKEPGDKGAGMRALREYPLCKLAIMWCQDPAFQEWLAGVSCADYDELGDPEAWAKQRLLQISQVDSRKELDTDQEAGELFKTMIREPYMRWLEKAA